ncbi:T9SS type A sorting domain-containing protein [Pontibacter sp. JH31]|uniref:T9SS type A sorting domain-containing protein n=1 Tax=Pontibacter aquaedesilientis TaxID=2766980 RepID=A0ABR7XHJ9_9BACT|nr:T9SS type A sorting domain-containing protein [Pontibacter aquaedesilientis]MBD1397731.1 T9SS type A sorting domain-containing protein [Pontibacter aquaedesilientis]
MKARFTLLIICTLLIFHESAAQFSSVTELTPLQASPFATREKQQSKVFTYADKHWSILASSTGTHLWRLDGSAWVKALELVTRNSRADYAIDGDVVHILLYSGTSSQFVSIKYNKAANKFEKWDQNKLPVSINLEEGVQIASVDRDKTGRMWIASTGLNGTVNLRWSDTPYTTWSSPIVIANGLKEDDAAAVIAMPHQNQIGVLWSNQNTKRWGFKVHRDGDSPTSWSQDEVPASQSALSTGSGMTDDHMSMKVASDGSLFCAIKTGYNREGLPLIALLVRRPTGLWENLHEVSQKGTLPIIVLNEAIGKLKVIYTSQTYGGDILYKESLMSKISFCTEHTLIRGNYNYATSTKQLYSDNVVILASNETQVVGVIGTDALSGSDVSLACDVDLEPKNNLFIAYPNPFELEATVSFVLNRDSDYSLILYDSKGSQVVILKEGNAVAGETNHVNLDGSMLSRGLYSLKLQTTDGHRGIKLIHHQ